MKTRILSLTLTLFILLGLLPTPALAVEDGPEADAVLYEEPLAAESGPEESSAAEQETRAGSLIDPDKNHNYKWDGEAARPAKQGDYLRKDQSKVMTLEQGLHSYFGPDLSGNGAPALIMLVQQMPNLGKYDGFQPQWDWETPTTSGLPPKDDWLHYASWMERDHFRNSDIQFIPFNAVVKVPAYTEYTLTYNIELTAKRSSKGTAGYYVECFDLGESVMDEKLTYPSHFMTGDTSQPSTGALVPASGQRLYSDKNTSIIAAKVQTEKAVVRNDTPKDMVYVRRFGLLIGVGESDSILNSYHHRMTASAGVKIECDYKDITPVAVEVAEVDGVGYTTIGAAVAAFNASTAADRTLKLLKDVDIGVCRLTKAGVVDLNGCVWTANSFAAQDGTTFKNGRLEAEPTTPSGSFLSCDGALTLTDVDIDAGPVLRGVSCASLDMTGGSVTNGAIAVYLTGKGSSTISGASITGRDKDPDGTASFSQGIAAAEGAGGTVTITDTSVKGDACALMADSDITWKLGANVILGAINLNEANHADIRYNQSWTGKLSLTDEPGRPYSVYGPTGATGVRVLTDGFNNAGAAGAYLTSAVADAYVRLEGTELALCGNKVIFNANGGTPEPEPMTVNGNGCLSSLPSVSQDGKTFLGWALSDGAFVEKNKTKFTDPMTVVTAQWEDRSVTLQFDSRGGSAVGSKTMAFNAPYGDLPVPTREGYTFAGWYKYIYDDGITLDEKVTATTPMTDTRRNPILYAGWTAQQYAVTFKTNASGVAAPASVNVTFGEKYGELPTPERPGYTFDGWTLAGGDSVTADTRVSVAGEHTLYAQWTKVTKTVTVTLHAQGGSLPSGGKPSFSVTTNETYGDGNLPAPTRDGYTFQGWYTEADGGSRVTGSSVVTLLDDHTLYARWKGRQCVVFFNANGGDGGGSVPVSYGDPVKAPADPTRTNYTFVGWYTYWDPEKGEEWDFNAPVTKNMSLYARWAGSTVEVTLHANGGLFYGTQESLTRKYRVNQYYDSMPVPRKDGYDFAGWYTAEDDGSRVTVNDLVRPEVKELWAHWNKETYTVTFNSLGGSEVKARQVVNGEPCKKPDDPTRPGYAFVGWYMDRPCTRPWDFDTPVTGNGALYAKWEAQSYTITFDLGGHGEFDTGAGGAQTVTHGGTYGPMPTPKETSIPDGSGGDTWQFTGWYTEAGGQGTQIAAGGKVELTSDATLHAYWQKKHIHKLWDGDTEGATEFATELPTTPEKDKKYISLTAGVYYLTRDITLEDGQYFDIDGTWTKVTICLNGHTITSGSSGRVFCMGNGSPLNLCDCVGTGKVVGSGAGTAAYPVVQTNDASYTSDTTFNLYGGTITGNKRSGDSANGGGVRIGNYTTFNMYGGSITNNAATNGGGVFVGSYGDFNLYGGTISGNTASNGGGVYADHSVTSNLSGGSITGNEATTDGGGVYVYSKYSGGTRYVGKLTMTGGTISGNTAGGNGGGVRVSDHSSFTMTGGEITGNTAAKGGGVYAGTKDIVLKNDDECYSGDNSNGAVRLGGTARIIGNKNTDSQDDDLKLEISRKEGSSAWVRQRVLIVPEGSDLGPLAAGARVGVSYDTIYETDATSSEFKLSSLTAKPGDFQHFVCQQGGYYIKQTDNVLYLVKGDAPADPEPLGPVSGNPEASGSGGEAAPHKHLVCGAAEGAACGHDSHAAEAVEFQPLTMTNGYLPGGNYYLTKDLDVTCLKINGTVNLCLNGYMLKGNTADGTLYMFDEELNLCDCVGSGCVTNASGHGVYLNSKGYDPYFTMYGGAIQGCSNYGVSVSGDSSSAKATFTMYGGEITGNTKGGVNVSDGYSVFTVSGLVNITGNKTSNVSLGTTTYDGDGTITIDERAAGSAIGVTAGYLDWDPPPVSITGECDSSLSACFTSDNKKYAVQYDETSKTVQLVAASSVGGGGTGGGDEPGKPAFTVTYEDDDGNLKTLPTDSDGKLTALPPDPNQENHPGQKFEGWFKEGEDAPISLETKFEEDTALEARWSDCPHPEGSVESETEGALSCDGEATITYTCKDCSATWQVIQGALGHDWPEAWTQEETQHTRTCRRDGCGETMVGPHVWVEGDPTNQSCTVAGTRTDTCSVCKKTRSVSIPAVGHVYGDWVTSGDQHWRECSVCHEKTGLAAHVWTEEVAKDATCQAAGSVKRTCDVCGKEVTEEIPTLAHAFSDTWEKDDAKHWHVCSVCKQAKSGEAEHVWDAGTVTKEATAENTAGELTYTCVECGKTKTVTYQYEAPGSDPGSLHAVTYNVGEHAGSAAPEAESRAKGQKFNLAAAPVRTGYSFQGWELYGVSVDDQGNAETTTDTYSAGAEFTMPGEAVTFYAGWKLRLPHTLTDGQKVVLPDGTEIERKSDTITITPPETHNDPQPPTTITVPGGDVVIKEDLFPAPTDKDPDATVDRVVVEVPGGSTIQTGDDGPEITVPDTTRVSLDGSVDPLPKGATITDQNGNEITVEDEGGSVDKDGNVITGDGEELSVTPDPDAVEVSGTITGADGAPVPGATVELKQGNTVYHRVTADDQGEYTISNVSPGIYDLVVTTDDGKTLTKLVTVGDDGLTEPVVLGENNSVLTVDGYIPVVAGGLDTEAENGKDITMEVSGSVTSGNDNSVTLSVELSRKVDGVLELVLPFETVSNDTGVVVTLDGAQLVPSDTGEENTYRVDEASGLVHIFITTGGDFTVKAGTPAASHTVTFDMRGHGESIKLPVAEGSAVRKPADPAAEGYTFGGWYKDEGCTELWKFDTERVTGDITLYARWTANTYQVSFDLNGVGESSPNSISVTYDSAYGTLPLPEVPANHTFLGWFTAADGGEEITAATTVKLTADHTLYAHWRDETREDSSAPAITKQPTAPTEELIEGKIPDDARLTVTVEPSEDGTLRYQWYEKDPNGGEPRRIEGATGPEFTIPGDIQPGTHEYYCEVTNTEPGKNPTSTNSDTVEVVVKPSEGPGSKPVVKPQGGAKLTITEGETEKIKVTVEPEGTPLTWTSSDPDVAKVDENGNVTAVSPGTVTITVTPEGGDPIKITVKVVDPSQIVELGDGITVTLPDDKTSGDITENDDGTKKVPEGSTVHIGDDDPAIILPDGGDVDPGTGEITVPEGGGSTITITDGTNETEITVPGGGTVKPNDDGTVTVPEGSEVQTGGGPEITVPDGTKVDPDGTITLPDGGGSTITITDDEGNETEITVPGGGTVKPNDDGTVTVPEGSEVQTGGGPGITVPDGTKVDPDGTITVPAGGDSTIAITDGTNETEITVPGGGTVKPNDDGTVTLPEGGTVQTGDGPKEVAPGSRVDPDGTITPPEGGREEIHIGNITITLPEGTTPEDVTDDDGTVTIPEGSEIQAGGTEITVPGGSTVDTDGTITLPEDSDGRITITDGTNETEITLPDDDKTVKPNDDGSVTVPGGSEVEKPDGENETVPEGGAKVKPDGTVTSIDTPAHTHAWATTWTSDEKYHWHACTVTDCPVSDNSRKDGYAAHRENGGTVIKEPTAGEPGLRMYQCVDCQRILRTETIPALGFEISGTVTQGGESVSGAIVTLRQGSDDIEKTTTDEEGNYSFTEVPPGTYNVVGTKDGKTVTKLVVLTEDHATGLNLEMPGENVNSILEVEPGDGEAAKISRTVVGGLDKEAEEQEEENATVTVTMTVKKEADTGTEAQTSIKAEAGDEEKLEFLAITIMKEVTSEQSTKSEELKETRRVIEIVVPYDFSGKGIVTVYRYHVDDTDGAKTEPLVPGNGEEGTFKLDRANGLIYIYTQKFSTYAIGYTEAEEEEAQKYKLTVNGGEGSGTYKAGETVFISPEVPGGKEFVRWKTSVEVTFTARQNGYTFTMPEDDVIITAQFNDVSVEPPAPPSGGDAWDDDDDDEPTYRPAVEKTEHGSVTVRPSNPEQGDRVTITVKPDKGYEVDEVTVTDRDGDPVRVRDNGDGTYTFTQPEGKVTIAASFRAVEPVKPDQPAGGWNNCPRDESCPIWPFTDAGTTAWYHDGVHYCVEKGLMNGFADGTFKPDATLSRAQLAQILYNREGRPAVFSGSPFTDVADDAWCASAVIWANQNGIVGGYGDGTFGPNNPITREQLAAMLWRYAKARGYDVSVGENTNILGYKDFDLIHEYAIPALQWATGAGVMQGKGDGILDPVGRATRAQAAVMLQRYLENVAK